MKLLLDYSDDPEFRIYAKNCIKEYFNGLTPEYIGKLAAEMITGGDGKPYTSRFDEIITREAKTRAEKAIPIYLGYGRNDDEKAAQLIRTLFAEAVRERVKEVIASDNIEQFIKVVVAEQVQKVFRNQIKEKVQQTVDELMK